MEMIKFKDLKGTHVINKDSVIYFSLENYWDKWWVHVVVSNLPYELKFEFDVKPDAEGLFNELMEGNNANS
jgi:hypothetical protein